MNLPWFPILAESQAARAEAAITAIAEALAASPPFPENDRFGASLATGEAGVALFFAYLDRARPGAGWGDLAGERLERAIDRLADAFHKSGLYQGFVGIAWTVEHLRDVSDPDDPDDPNGDVDTALLKLLASPSWSEPYDLTSGLAGFGIYALERRLHGRIDFSEICLDRICAHLEALSEPRDEGRGWPTAAHLLFPHEIEKYPGGMWNLGVAHGLPGVLPVLAQTAYEPARDLLRGAVSWLLSRKLPAESDSVFPPAWGPGTEPFPARAAWCYGDPGIAASLLVTARAAGEPAWEAEALALAHRAARRSPEVSGIRDAGLCHGAAGLGHIFNRIYQATGDPELRAAAEAWICRSLDFREPGRGVGGFRSWGPGADGEMGWCDDLTLLTGAAGVGLALLAATAPIEPAWDRFLAISSGESGIIRG